MTTKPDRWQSRKGLWWTIPIVLVALASGFLYFRPAMRKSADIHSFVGKWEGKFTWLDKTKSFPIAVTFHEDQTYEFETVLRVSKGKVEINEMTIQLLEKNTKAAAFTLGEERGEPVLTGEIEKIGTYRLSRAK